MRRTHPGKSLLVDFVSKWKGITWDEALDEIAADDPMKILWVFTTIRSQTGTFGIQTFGGILHNYSPRGDFASNVLAEAGDN